MCIWKMVSVASGRIYIDKYNRSTSPPLCSTVVSAFAFGVKGPGFKSHPGRSFFVLKTFFCPDSKRRYCIKLEVYRQSFSSLGPLLSELEKKTLFLM